MLGTETTQIQAWTGDGLSQNSEDTLPYLSAPRGSRHPLVCGHMAPVSASVVSAVRMSILPSSYKDPISGLGAPTFPPSHLLRPYFVGTMPLTVNPTIGNKVSAVTSGGDLSYMCSLAWSMGAMMFVSSLWAGHGTFHFSSHLVPGGKVILAGGGILWGSLSP